MPACPATVRLATESDIPAIIVLLLTSFRQFPLFSRLHAPLSDNLSNAYDTAFFWRHRLLANLLDYSATVLIAEIDRDCGVQETVTRESSKSVDKESWEMFDWVGRRPKQFSQIDQVSGKMAIGFVICRSLGVQSRVSVGWRVWLRSLFTSHANIISPC